MSYDLVRIAYLASEIEDVARRVRTAAKEQDAAELAALASQGRITELARRLDGAIRGDKAGRVREEPLTEAELWGGYKGTGDKE